MIVSFNWLKKFVKIDLSATDLAKEIGAKLVEVEDVQSLAPKYAGVKIARVKSVEKIAESHHLSLCKIDDGGVNQQIERDKDGLIQVVCGAPNVKADANIAWIIPGEVVPSTFGNDDEFRLVVKPLMGHVSNGMIASARELDLYDEHDGILILDESLTPGSDFTEAYELDDYLFDIENKSLTQRPDCFGVIGFAREVATILGQEFKSPQWLTDEPDFIKSKAIKVFIQDEATASKYQLAELDNLKNIKGLSLLEKTYLARVGVRPVSPIVDVTNYLMLLSAQPLHAFDADKVAGICAKQGLSSPEVGVRLARAGEKLVTLDGRTLQLDVSDIVISAGAEAIGLAGAMGGKSTEIDASTQRVFLESASFDLYKLRTTQMRHGIFSEAITRFTKGQPASLTAPVLAEAGRWLVGEANLSVAKAEQDFKHGSVVTVNFNWANEVLGTKLSQADMVRSLTNAEFSVEAAGDDLIVTMPFWRTDVTEPIEVVEEIGRVFGYDNIAPTLPLRQAVAVESSAFDQFAQQIRNLLTRAGANEVLTYSFVSADLIEKAGQDPTNSYKIINSISPELQLCRQSLQPSLINLIHANIKADFNEFALYEINRVQQKSDGLIDEKVPVEKSKLALVVAKKQSSQTAFYLAKKYLTHLLNHLGLPVKFTTLKQTSSQAAMFEPKRSAQVVVGGEVLGVIGEYKSSVKKNFKLPSFSAGWEIDLDQLFAVYATRRQKLFASLAKFPSTTKAICFESQPNLSFADLEKAIKSAVVAQDLSITFRPIDIFQSDDGRIKRTTFEFVLNNPNKTITSDEANLAIDKITEVVTGQLKVRVA